MIYLFTSLFRMPIWLLLLFAAGFASLGFDCRERLRQEATEQAELLASPQPPAVAISTFDPKPEGRAVVEAHVTARWAPEYNSKLFTTQKDGHDTPDGTLLILLNESATADTARQVAAVIVTRPKDHDRLMDWMTSHIDDLVLPHPLVRLEGVVGNAAETRHVENILKKRGLTRAPGFFYLDPYLDGRTAALTPDPGRAESAPWPFWGVALALTALAGLRFALRGKTQAAPRPAPIPAARLAKPTNPAARKRWAKIALGAGVLALLIWLGWSGYAITFGPIAVVLFAWYGFRTAARKVGNGSIRALDLLTGVATPRAASNPGKAAMAPPATGPIVTVPGIGQRSVELLRNRRFTQWQPFFGMIAMLIVGGYLAAGTQGVKDRFAILAASLTGKPQAMEQFQNPPSVVGDTPLTSPFAAGYHGLQMLGVTLALAFLATYARRWLNRRYGLALDDPWERLDSRLRIDRTDEPHRPR
jgi:hypothetical protein